MQDELLKTFHSLMRAKGEVILPASGLSMYPYILPKDECRFLPITDQLVRGAIGLFVTDEGVLTSHRLHRVEPWGDEERYWLRGDGNFAMDVPVGREQIIGVLSELRRKGRIVTERRFDRRLWGRAAIRYPLLLKFSAHASRRKAEHQVNGMAEGGE